jgi:hypothetical protein
MNDCQIRALEARLALLDFSEREIKLVMDAVRDCNLQEGISDG